MSETGKSEIFIEVAGLSKSLGGHDVLAGMDLSIRRGETLVIIGRSGEGKSVFIKHLIGLMVPDAGSIKVDGQEIVGLKERELAAARKKVGILFQNGALFDSLTVAENVAFPLMEEGEKKADVIETRVTAALASVGMDAHLAKMPVHLSGGQRKRVALARAIVTHPQCILYDEPTAGLDPIATDSIDLLIKSIQAKYNVTSVVITHDMKSVHQIADRIVFLRQGRVYFLGTSDELKASTDPLIQDFIHGRSNGGASADL